MLNRDETYGKTEMRCIALSIYLAKNLFLATMVSDHLLLPSNLSELVYNMIQIVIGGQIDRVQTLAANYLIVL